MKYKIYTLFSVIIISLVFQAGASAGQINSTEKSLALLEYTDVLKTEDDNIERYVTRAEFCDYLFRALKLSGVTDKRYFTDVPQEYSAAGQINALTEIGIVNYAPDGLFNPDNDITYEQACKLIVYALGYKDFCPEEGNMAAYVSVAGKIGINAQVKDYSHITLEEAANILFLGMSATLSEKLIQSGDLYTVVNKDGPTLFEQNFNIYFDRGQLRALDCCGIDGIAKKGTAEIGGINYDIYENINLEPLFGETVDYAYEKNENGRDKIIYAASYYKDARLVIPSDEVLESDNSFISFYKDKTESKTKKVSFNRPAIVYNGKIFTGSFEEEMAAFISGRKTGFVELIKTDGSVYDLIVIKSYSFVYTTAYDSTSEILYGRERNIDIGGYEEWHISGTSGVITDIPKRFPAVMAVAESEDAKLADIVICNGSKEIKISQYSDDEIVTESGETYTVSEYAAENLDYNLQAGREYTVYFDMNGNICYFDWKNGDTMRIGWIRTADISKKNGITLSVYDHSDNKTSILKLADKVRIDGKRYETDDINNIALAFPGKVTLDEKQQPIEVSPQVIRYSLNENAEITEIDTTNVGNENPNESLREIDRGVRSWSSFEGWLGMRILCSPSTSVTKRMTVSGADCPDLVTTTKSPNDSQYKNTYSIPESNIPVMAYKWTDKSLYADLIVVPVDWQNIEYTIYMFAGTSKIMDESGEVLDVAYAYGYGKKMTFIVDDPNCLAQFEALNYGDLFNPTTKFGDNIQEIKRIFDVKTLTFEPNGATYTDPDRYWYYGDPYGGTAGLGSGWYNSNCQAAKAYPVKVKDDTLGVSYTLAGANADNIEMLLSAREKSVIVYDSSKPKKNAITIESFGSIKTFENCGTDCDIMVFTSKNYSGRQIFVIRR